MGYSLVLHLPVRPAQYEGHKPNQQERKGQAVTLSSKVFLYVFRVFEKCGVIIYVVIPLDQKITLNILTV